jgi:two-component system LytT family response regulator
MFLDIQMPGMNGFEVIDAMGVDAMPATVFVTAYDEFALRAFEVEAIDYLLKPFEEERFRKAFERALGRIEARTKDAGQIARVLARALPGDAFLQRQVVRDGGRLLFVNVKDILWLSAQENYVEIHTLSGTHLIRDSLSHLEGRLDSGKFARFHRSENVNIDSIQELKSWSHGDYIVLLKNGTRLRLSRRYQHRLLHRFE